MVINGVFERINLIFERLQHEKHHFVFYEFMMDNLKQKFKDSFNEVRKRTLSIVGDRDANIETIKEPDSYKREILVLSRKLAGSIQKEERIEAIARIGHLSWTGGPRAAKCAGDLLVTIIGILSHTAESEETKLVVIKTLAELCYLNVSIQDKARQYGLPDLLGSIMNQRTPQSLEIRKWSTYAVMMLVLANYENQIAVLGIETMKDSLKRLSREKWRGWESNEAAELMLYLGMSQ